MITPDALAARLDAALERGEITDEEARESGWLLSKWGGMADATPIRPLAGEPWWLADDGTRYTRADLIGA